MIQITYFEAGIYAGCYIALLVTLFFQGRLLKKVRKQRDELFEDYIKLGLGKAQASMNELANQLIDWSALEQKNSIYYKNRTLQ